MTMTNEERQRWNANWDNCWRNAARVRCEENSGGEAGSCTDHTLERKAVKLFLNVAYKISPYQPIKNVNLIWCYGLGQAIKHWFTFIEIIEGLQLISSIPRGNYLRSNREALLAGVVNVCIKVIMAYFEAYGQACHRQTCLNGCN